jgi:hypothetical protein
VRVGHTFESLAAVTVPEQLPIQVMQLEGFPQIISELGWTNPNRFRADATLLAAAYGALQGTDGIYFFAIGSNYMRDTGMSKFATSCPVISGTFPATALLYRRADVQEAQPVVYQVLNLEDLYAMKGSGASTAAALDELRRRDIPAGGLASGAVSNFDPLSFYVGRVVRTFGPDTAKSFQKDLSRYIDRKNKRIASLTGELLWDYGSGLAIVNTTRTQGIAGFLKGRKIDLPEVTVECSNEFASVIVTALDEAPLAESKRILIQAMTEEEPYGFGSTGGTITNLGGGPLGVRKIAAKVTLRSRTGGQPRVVALDENGYATSKPVQVSGGAGAPLAVILAQDSIYHVVQR